VACKGSTAIFWMLSPCLRYVSLRFTRGTSSIIHPLFPCHVADTATQCLRATHLTDVGQLGSGLSHGLAVFGAGLLAFDASASNPTPLREQTAYQLPLPNSSPHTLISKAFPMS